MTKSDFKAGRFYRRTKDGLIEVSDAEHRRDLVGAWLCRRVADFPNARPPAGADITPCEKCGALIAYNPARVDDVPPDTPKVCLQCASIQPLPITDA